MNEAVEGPDGDTEEESSDFVAGERDQVVRSWVVGVFVGADNDEEGVGEHGEGVTAQVVA